MHGPAGVSRETVAAMHGMTSKGPLCELAMDEQREVPGARWALPAAQRGQAGLETVPGIAFSQSSPSVSMSRSSR